MVPDLSQVAEQLEGLEDCPEDLYLIEGDPQSFDDSVFSVDELEKAVVVKIADRQWRYSRFPSLPLFGRAARENRIETLHACLLYTSIFYRFKQAVCHGLQAQQRQQQPAEAHAKLPGTLKAAEP